MSCTSSTNCVNANHLVMVPKAKPTDWEEIWARMLKKTKEVETEEWGVCLIWTASTSGNYGRMSIKKVDMSAHRASYLVKTKGEEIPTEIDGEIAQVRHLCGNDLCVAHDHLEIGTILENQADKIVHGTVQRGEKSKFSKITEETASKIKKSRFERGETGYESQRKRAERFGVSESTVNNIDCGSSWAHLEDRHGKTTSTDNRRAKIRKRKRASQASIWSEDDFRRAGEILYQKISKSETSKRYEVDGECWNFTGDIHNGYGRDTILGKRKFAHVISCEIKERRHSRKSEHTRHLCGNERCIAPHHLVFGSARENALDTLKNGTKRAKLDEQKVRNIRKSALSTLDLAKKHKVSGQTIRQVRNSQTWSHVV